MKFIEKIPKRINRILISGAPGGYDALILAELARGRAGDRDIVFIARDDVRRTRMADALSYFAPELEHMEFPAWDCLPYDRVSPDPGIVAKRIDALTRLLMPRTEGKARVVLTTVSAFLQRVPPRNFFDGATMRVVAGVSLRMDQVVAFLTLNGYLRSDTVMNPGEFAVRGGIIDIFPGGSESAFRLDFFGDEIDAIRVFDSISQRTTGKAEEFSINPVSEIPLTEEAVSRFRSGYRELFGAPARDDVLYEAVSAGRRHRGMEHWMALFHERMETLLDYLPGAALVLDHQGEEAGEARLDLIAEYYAARRVIADGKTASAAPPYNPVPAQRLYLGREQWQALLVDRKVYDLSPFSSPDAELSVDAEGRLGRDFADARNSPDVNVFDALRAHLQVEREGCRRVLIAAFTAGSLERLAKVMEEHDIGVLHRIERWDQFPAMDAGSVAICVFAVERGFTAPGLTVIAEQDILGERLSVRGRRRARPEDYIAEASSLREGDLVVHIDHGIARYGGLVNIEVVGAPHDCLLLIYTGNDKLFLPVENINLISRYGSEQASAQLDRLGGAAWQARKARMKQRIRDMADELIKVAAARALRPAPTMAPDSGAFEEFCARFPFEETEDQQAAITNTINDLASGIPTDRLVCGDVGFGKTEVAMRAAFVAALSGRQVAVVTPTTLLCRQHFQTFRERFAGFPIKIEQLSRMVTLKKANEVKRGLADGSVDVVIGTHALVAKNIQFRDLGLLVVDEEQHFGVTHKERLKKLKSDVHVLTLTATPIPRTLQLALSGVRELSIIASPPVDRLAVRTFILPYDPLIIREALLRERYRGGQSFYVCPRIEDMDGVARGLKELVPELKLAFVHGRMPPSEIEDVMTAFYDGSFDVLLSTNIIESGLDLPSVNTIVIHRADMFGLAQLYQLRGRVGRSKVRAYAYLTLPPRQKLSATAEKRLEVMHTLDTLGAGFTLASYDLDIRGAGNLLGGEQSGHIREVGIELYQQMLEEAVAEARGVDGGAGSGEEWSPQIDIGMPVLIPELYVSDLTVRLNLYRRIARLADPGEIDAFAAEMIDRFGALPQEVENLLQTMAVKRLCMECGVDKVDAGPKGAVVSFRNADFANPQGLIGFITANVGTVKLRPDHKLVFMRVWDNHKERLAGVQYLLKELVKIAEAAAG
ncbi:MAG: transcription-repair coupling factor [Rhodospirillales bacterium RIFCSPLOWO2_12_FULL_58_28]|nr:MAG: transcription-repair coupling factor [Rhodospirillales bacterium RIFCSPLOWO2_02_FULL_58_16]OHC77549.1 MAG: transcription-repair coupling factor [Rhodospirillales bacterium RIFCSPLOWO2_12_FULL_58_28]